jgi:hypothetical protein
MLRSRFAVAGSPQVAVHSVAARFGVIVTLH